MKTKEIHYSEAFGHQFKTLPIAIKKKALKQEQFFRENHFHPSLRLHKLQGKLDGLWSISINRSYRIIFKVKDDGNILFVSVGLHAIYQT